VAGDSIPFLFRYDATDSFHTTFVYDRRSDTWQWHMDNDSAGVRRPVRPRQPDARVSLFAIRLRRQAMPTPLAREPA